MEDGLLSNNRQHQQPDRDLNSNHFTMIRRYNPVAPVASVLRGLNRGNPAQCGYGVPRTEFSQDTALTISTPPGTSTWRRQRLHLLVQKRT